MFSTERVQNNYFNSTSCTQNTALFDHVKLLQMTRLYPMQSLSFGNYQQICEDLRQSKISFTNFELENTLQSLGFSIPCSI